MEEVDILTDTGALGDGCQEEQITSTAYEVHWLGDAKTETNTGAHVEALKML